MAIAGEILQIEGLAYAQKDVIYPERLGQAVPGLQIRQGGVECKWMEAIGQSERICGWVVASKSAMYRHCKEKHGWKNERRRGGSKKQRAEENPSRVWDEDVWYQGFFATGGWRRCFRIQAENGASDLTAEQRETGGKMAEQYKQGLLKSKEKQVIQESRSRYEANPWLEMTGWVEHLAGIEKKKVWKVVQATEREMTDEERLAREGIQKQRERRQGRSHLMIEEQEDEDESERTRREEEFGGLDEEEAKERDEGLFEACLLYTSPSPRDGLLSRMPSSA